MRVEEKRRRDEVTAVPVVVIWNTILPKKIDYFVVLLVSVQTEADYIAILTVAASYDSRAVQTKNYTLLLRAVFQKRYWTDD